MEHPKARSHFFLHNVPFRGVLALAAFLILISLITYKYAAKGTTVLPGAVGPSGLPPFTQDVQAQLAASKGFAVLVSYTEAGFEPQQVSIKQGEAVRFTNNSSSDLWVASDATTEHPAYPGTSDCGGSSLDTCKVLKPHEFWEFTFGTSGTWLFQNNLDKSKTGTMTVTVAQQ